MRDLYKKAMTGEPFAGQKLAACGQLLGLFHESYPVWLSQITPKAAVLKDDAKINTLIAARLDARAAKNWAESDRIRDELAAMGIVLKDGKDAEGNAVTTWEVKR